MTHNQGLLLTAAVALVTATVVSLTALSASPAPPPAPAPAKPTASAPATQPKALTENTQSALKWLIAQQAPDGGWAQGEESAAMGNSQNALRDKSNVGDTCMAVLALLRSGSTPSSGPYADNIRKGITFISNEIDKSDDKSLSITSVNGTRIQMKLGPNVDTFLASLMLGEVRNKISDEAFRKRTIAALDKVMDKIEKNVKADGQVATGGWAASLAQGIAVRGANVAAANGAIVSEGTLRSFETNSMAKQGAGGMTVTGTDSAGVQLYAQASNLSAMQQSQDRLEAKKADLTHALSSPATAPADKAKYQAELKDVEMRMDANGKQLQQATEAAGKLVQDDRFIAGFGSNGGEEFLSYLNLGESLFKKGGDDWKNWDTKMVANLNNIQNKDGSWSGQHCITSRTFCTSAALLVLMIDREDAQIADQIKKR